MWTFEYKVTSEYILRTVIWKNPILNILNTETIKLLDQINGKFYTVQPESAYRTESQVNFYGTGWESDQYENKHVEVGPVIRGEWDCFNIIESKQSSDNNPLGIGHESKKITRICKIPEIKALIRDDAFFKFFGFFRTDIDIPFNGIVTNQWINFPTEVDISEINTTISKLIKLKEVSGTPVEIDQILRLPIHHG